MPTKIPYVDEVWNPKIIERFWGYVNITPDCWLWKAGCFQNGYGQFRVGKKKVKAHRFAYQITYGRILPTICVCHKCDNPKCVNPKHLFLSTPKGNALDREAKKRSGDGGSKTKRRNGLAQGINNPAHKLTPILVKTIRKYRKKGHTYSELVEGIEFTAGIVISKSQIANIVHRRSWKNVR